MNGTGKRMERAIVIGASISGLTAARVLADYFEQVIVVERDILPPPGEPRKGVPQGRHLHVLLARGRELLEGFFPGLTQELIDQGAIAGDLSETGRWFSDGRYSLNFTSGLLSVQASRPLMEGTIYRRLCALPNMTVLQNHEAAGLLSTPGEDGKERRVTGVLVRDRSQGETLQGGVSQGKVSDGDIPQGEVSQSEITQSEITQSGRAEKRLEADLVVDAGGRGSHGLAWLESLGYARPKEEQIKVRLSYTTREFHLLPEHAGGSNAVVIMPSFDNRRGGVMLALEGGRWMTTLAGFLGEAAPTDLPGFIEYARSLNAPDIYDVVRAAEPLGEPRTYKYPASQRRYFEKLDRFPEGYLVTGDALCSFNPIYGQGMTTAASEAALLGECLREGLPGIARRFFRKASRLLDSPWSIAAGSDLIYPEVEGKRTPAMRLARLYLDRLLKVSSNDPVVNVAFQRVTNLMDPPASLFRPGIVRRVMFPKKEASPPAPLLKQSTLQERGE